MRRKETYIIFSNGDGITSKFLKKGFGHIKILVCDGFSWILIDPTFTHLDWYILPITAQENPFVEYISESTIIRMFNTPVKKKIWVGKLGILSCVLIVRYYLGIHNILLTPYQLYKFILRHELGEHYGW